MPRGRQRMQPLFCLTGRQSRFGISFQMVQKRSRRNGSRVDAPPRTAADISGIVTGCRSGFLFCCVDIASPYMASTASLPSRTHRRTCDNV